MEEEYEYEYREGYFIYSLTEDEYIKYLGWGDIEYTHKIYDAKEFRDKESAIEYCKDKGFSYFRIDKAYILLY